MKINLAPFKITFIKLCVILFSVLVFSCSSPQSYDILLINGQLIDGLGNPAQKGKIGIKEGKMYVLGPNASATAPQTIDAAGLIIAPGFIDVHSHTGSTIIQKENNDNEGFVRQGVTTIVAGPDGRMNPDQLQAIIDSLAKNGAGTHVASYMGHGTIRAKVMGNDQQRAPRPEELEAMKDLVKEGMAMGALGLSTGLMYEPGMFSETEEIIELAKVAATYRGIYDSHVRNPVFDWMGSNEEVIEIGRQAKIPVKMGHLKAVGLNNAGKSKELIAKVEAALQEGIEVVSDQYPYDGAGGRMTLRTVLIPSANRGETFKFYRDPTINLDEYIATPAKKAKVKEYTENGVNGGFSWIKAVGYTGLRIVDSPDYPELVGKYLSHLAEERGKDPFDMMCELVVNAKEAVQVKGGILEEDVQALLKQPWNMVASDGLAVKEDGPKVGHPRSTGTFPKVLGHYVRELGVLSLEEAIRKMTSLPADFVGLYSRGRLADGLPADIVVFDPNTIIDQSTYADPNRFSKGIIHVLINGEFVLRDELMSKNRPGRFLPRER